MSFSTQQISSFMTPLLGKTTTFLVRDRATNLHLAETLLSCLTADSARCIVLDFDAFYSSNSDALAGRLPSGRGDRVEIVVPGPGKQTDGVLSALFAGDPDRGLIVDSANSVYQLLSSENAKSASRKFSVFIAALSWLARFSRKPAFLSMYEREKTVRRGGSRSLAEFSDITARVSLDQGGTSFRCAHGTAWQGGGFYLPSP